MFGNLNNLLLMYFFHLGTGAKPNTQAYQGSRRVLLIYLGCNGGEESIFNCMLDQDGSCTNDEVAGVVCTQSELQSCSMPKPEMLFVYYS